MKLIAKTFPGLEEVLAEELRELGAHSVKALKRAVQYEGSKKLMYQSNMSLSTALRILQPIHSFKATTEEALYQQVFDFDLSYYLKIHNTFAVDSTVFSPHFKHSKYVALKVKDAIVDRFRKTVGQRPNVDTKYPDVRLNVHVAGNNVTLALDSSGSSLHQRGYREKGHRAPMNEVLAAGLVRLTGWKGEKPFLDPMCGSGTLVAEAVHRATNTPVNFDRRSFGFHHWANFQDDVFKEARNELWERRNEPKVKFYASDQNRKPVAMTRDSMKRCGFEKWVKVDHARFQDIKAPADEGIIITNPPYGERIKSSNLNELYSSFGDLLKTEFQGWEAWIFSASNEALKSVGLSTSKRLHLYNASLPTKFHKYELYAGSKKAKANS